MIRFVAQKFDPSKFFYLAIIYQDSLVYLSKPNVKYFTD